ncbi:hypothetical protein FA15DRAFT_672690 [Coprinopsis marcescibilis]|uniref:Extracellular membrane protein CFEM domain-containing protein n=1 Tax=Coprinopsis marcescibilis TaxID=230819 RepID=A0A5C3KM05_COPMA|nr:hypothetical protein FA15DRAFT_672690 [Coprinopsis marcescibilis]
MRVSLPVATLALCFGVSTASLVSRQEGGIDDAVPEQCRADCQAYVNVVEPCLTEDSIIPCACTPELMPSYATCAACLIPLAEAGQLEDVTRERLEGNSESFEFACAEAAPNGGTPGEPTGDDSPSSPSVPSPSPNGAPGGGNGSGALATRGSLSFAAFFVAVTFVAFHF